ncbi:type VI secretion system contractile sheath small subunit [Roseinatronobacter monicus]|uniref:Type VI secretion system protein ImpB n=1 Tax=Roseinatronobacter monicus TaxID=393481 RepID=A0A543K4H0_9RHOB|nr:type VI secretion system contractile sheath small subunit [Roseinatronobacter monicus]TQM89976.1 type VI secretion system protein ImpB [Roseinatronobacter monicus]
MSKTGSVAPKERINVKFVPATGGQQAEVELPLKMVVLGDFSGRPDDSPVETRRAVEIDKNTFGSVMREMGLERSFEVKNVLAEDDPDATLRALLKFDTLQDFSPDSIAQQVPELRKLVELREALTALKGPLGNMPSFRKALEELVDDPVRRQELLKEVGEIRDAKDGQDE